MKELFVFDGRCIGLKHIVILRTVRGEHTADDAVRLARRIRAYLRYKRTDGIGYDFDFAFRIEFVPQIENDLLLRFFKSRIDRYDTGNFVGALCPCGARTCAFRRLRIVRAQCIHTHSRCKQHKSEQCFFHKTSYKNFCRKYQFPKKFLVVRESALV